MTTEVNFLIAFIAGLVSFLAPCSGVLIPAFIANLAGTTFSEVEKAGSSLRTKVILNTLLFITGFTIVFVLLGASIGAVSQTIRAGTDFLSKIGGLLIIVFGLYALGLLKIPALSAEHRLNIGQLGKIKYLGSFLVGNAFAVGWTPCVGPILAAILVLAGASGSAALGTSFLFAYSVGLMLPFLLVGIFTAQSARFLLNHAKLLTYVNYFAGILLIFLGILVFTGNLAKLVAKLYFLSPVRI